MYLCMHVKPFPVCLSCSVRFAGSRCAQIVCRNARQDGAAEVTSAAAVERRNLLLMSTTTAFAGISGLVIPALADTEKYKDPEDGFAVTVPASWSYAVPTEPYDRFRSE